MYIKDLQSGEVRKYGSNHHDSLCVSRDGTTLSYYNLQNGDGSRFGDYRFCDKDGLIPEEDEVLARYGADAYFNIGGFDEVVRKPVKGYEGYYEVDQFGRVFSIDREVIVNDNGRIYKKPIKGKRLKQSVHTCGYKTVPLTKNGKTKTAYVHRIVAEAFIDNPNNLPYINHKDEDKTYNFVENLEWCTASYNNTYNGKNVKHSKKIKGRPLTEEHKRKISNSLKRYYGERGEADDETGSD